MLTEHVLTEGYADIVFVGGYPGVSSLIDRLGGFERTMHGAGLERRSVLGSYDQASGQRIVLRTIADAECCWTESKSRAVPLRRRFLSSLALTRTPQKLQMRGKHPTAKAATETNARERTSS